MVSTATIAEYTSGLDFPVNKQQLIKQAQSKNAPQEVIETLQKMPQEDNFHSMADVWQAVGKVD
jgi:hypothetical protein